MPDPELVSLIIRTEGRRRAYLADALHSARAQTYRPLEIVVVEDGASDLAEWLTDCERGTDLSIRHVPIAKRGRAGAGNAGLAAAAGAWLGFLDEDDLLIPDHVQTLITTVQRDAPGTAVYAAAQMVATRGLSKGQYPPKDKKLRVMGTVPFSREALWSENFLSIQSVLFHRGLYSRNGGFDEALPYFEDWDLWIRYSRECAFVQVDAITSTFRVPAEPNIQQARNAAHAEVLPVLRAKHQAEEGPYSPISEEVVTSRMSIDRVVQRLRSFLGGG